MNPPYATHAVWSDHDVTAKAATATAAATSASASSVATAQAHFLSQVHHPSQQYSSKYAAPSPPSCQNVVPRYDPHLPQVLVQQPLPVPQQQQQQQYSQELYSHHQQYVRNNHDGSLRLDHHGRPLTVARLLSTKPLRSDLLTRPGPGNRKLLYLAGDTVTRTLNDIFGFDGWHLAILNTTQTVCQQPAQPQGTSDNGKGGKSGGKSSNNNSSSSNWHVAYTSHVRITHRASNTHKEDVGAGDASDKSLGTAIQHAIKASVTDALKRAARHFGDKLGNSLYQSQFNVHAAPRTMAQALDEVDQDAVALWGATSCATNTSTATTTTTTKGSTVATKPATIATPVAVATKIAAPVPPVHHIPAPLPVVNPPIAACTTVASPRTTGAAAPVPPPCGPTHPRPPPQPHAQTSRASLPNLPSVTTATAIGVGRPHLAPTAAASASAMVGPMHPSRRNHGTKLPAATSAGPPRTAAQGLATSLFAGAPSPLQPPPPQQDSHHSGVEWSVDDPLASYPPGDDATVVTVATTTMPGPGSNHTYTNHSHNNNNNNTNSSGVPVAPRPETSTGRRPLAPVVQQPTQTKKLKRTVANPYCLS